MKHLAIIMDGNGRWATERGLSRGRGHIAGARNAFSFITEVRRRKIPVLSLFAFSKENWSRPPREVSLLMSLLSKSLEEKVPAFLNQSVRVHIIGDSKELPQHARESLVRVEQRTRSGRELDLILAVNYSGRYDIEQAARKGDIASHLQTAAFPPPDLIIRTGGETRISNYYLWQSAYAEIHFEEKFWPDFKASDLGKHLEIYAKTERRFGNIRDTRTRCR